MDEKDKRKELEYMYIDLFIEETKMIFEDPLFQKKVMKLSKSQKNLKDVLFNMKKFKRYSSYKNLAV